MSDWNSTARRMLATDLDGTMVGHPEALSRLSAVLETSRSGWLVVYATGRTLASARRLMEREGLPEPDIWVTEVGASITYADGRVGAGWRALMARHWDRDLVERTADAWGAMVRQPEEAMGPFKVSYYVDPADARRVFPALDAQMRQAGSPVRLVYSSQRDLDITPAAAGKGVAVRRLLDHHGIPLSRLLTCGDSANDHDMLCLGAPAVAVGNAHAELLEAGLPATVLRASGHCAEGILEALQHYRWLDQPEVAGKP